MEDNLMPFKCQKANILLLQADALVMPANTRPKCGSGLDRKIYSLANPTKLLEARKKIGDIDVGDSKITDSYSLSNQFKFIIHTVSPRYYDGNSNEVQLLQSCYESALQLAVKQKCNSIIFPLLSTGVFHFPIHDAINIARTTCINFLIKHNIDITLVVYDEDAVNAAKPFLLSIENYIFANIYDRFTYNDYRELEKYTETLSGYYESNDQLLLFKQKIARKHSDEERLKAFENNSNVVTDRLSFVDMYEQLKAAYGNPKDAEICRRLNINQRVLSNIKSGASCTRDRLWQFSIALHLNISDADKLFQSAGKFMYCEYKLSSDGIAREKAFEFFLNNKIYDIGEIEDQLSQLKLSPLFPSED